MPYDDNSLVGQVNKLYYSNTKNLAIDDDQLPINVIDIDKIIEQAIQDIYNNNNQFINQQLFQLANSTLQNAVDNTFEQTSKLFVQKNQQFINQLKYNTGVFAAFKTHNQTKLLKEKLLDQDQKLRSFSDFKKETKNIVSHHNKQWLRTEYNTAVRSARMAANWKQIEAQKHIYPNIEYVQSRSAQKDIDHLKLVGTIRPVDDDFWKTYTPPLRWGCKCSIRPTRKNPTTVPTNLPIVEPEFQFNPGTDAMIVNIEKHPYKNELKKQEALKVYDWYYNQYKIEVLEKINDFKKKIDEYKGLVILNNNLITKKLTFLRGTIRNIKGHNKNISVWAFIPYLINDINNWQYLGWQTVETKHKEAEYFLYYKTIIGNKERFINVIFHKHYKSEVIYAILDKIDVNSIIKGKP